MQETTTSSYPDISKILAAKTARRRRLAALSWEEKVAIVSNMQNLLPKGKWRDPTAGAGKPETIEDTDFWE